MKTQHTPGPWQGGRAISGPTGLVCRVVSRKGGWRSKTDANRYDYPTAPDEQEADANARLIAAAPSMYDVLVNLRVWLTAPDVSAETLENMNAQVESVLASLNASK